MGFLSCWKNMAYKKNKNVGEISFYVYLFSPSVKHRSSSKQSKLEGSLFECFIKISIPSVSPRNKKTLKILKKYKNYVIHFPYEFSNRPKLEFSHHCKPMHHPYDDGQIKEQKNYLNFLTCNLTIKLFLFSL